MENYIGIVHVLRKFAFSPGECYETVEWFGKAGLPHLMISDCMPPSPDFFPTSESVNDLTKLFLCKPSVQLFQDLQTLNNINHFLRGGIFSWVKHYLVLDYNRPISFFFFFCNYFPYFGFQGAKSFVGFSVIRLHVPGVTVDRSQLDATWQMEPVVTCTATCSSLCLVASSFQNP